MDPLEGIQPDHDTTYVLMREAENRGAGVWCCRARDLVHRDNELSARARPVRVTGEFDGNFSHFEQTADRRRVSLDQFELVWMREDPPFDQQYLHATYLLDESPVPVLNDPTGLRNSNEKLLILKFPDLIPSTWVGSDLEEAAGFLSGIGEGVVKSLDGYGGEEVYRVTDGSTEAEETLEMVTDGGETTVMIQAFQPSVVSDGDRRLILLGGEPIGGLTRLPAEGDFRANLHSGGRAGDAYVSDAERAICDKIKPELRRRGLHLVGLDLVDDLIMEINVTSPTCVQEINRLANTRLEEEIHDYVERTILD